MSRPPGEARRFRSYVDVVRANAALAPGRSAYTFLIEGEQEVGRVTFGELERQARTLAGLLQEFKAGGERALLLYPPGLEYVVAFYGCLLGGVIAVPAYPPRTNRNLARLQSIIQDCRATLALTTAKVLSSMEQWTDFAGLSSLRWMATDVLDEGLPAGWRDPSVGTGDVAFLQYTSGSTSRPKGVVVTHGNLLQNQAMMREGLGHHADTVVLTWLPLYHDMGLIGNILASAYNGLPCYFMAPADFLKRPLGWLSAISKHRATLSGGPNFAYDLCVERIRPEQCLGLDLSSWEVAFNGAEPVRAETLRRFERTFAPHGFRADAFYPCYGLAEATLFVSGGDPGRGADTRRFRKAGLERNVAVEVAETEAAADGAAPGAHTDAVDMVSCGKAWLEEELRIVDPECLEPSGDGEVGEIWIGGPTVAQGYWDQPESTAATFAAHIRGSGEGPYLRTGDLGFLHEGELYVTGRLKDLIILHGRNHYPQDIEHTAEASHPALRAGCSAAFSLEEGGLVLVAEVAREHRRQLEAESLVAAVREAVAVEHGIELTGLFLIPPGTLPKTSSGKVQRQATRKAVMGSELESLFAWSLRPEPAPMLGGGDGAATSAALDSLRGWLALEVAKRLKVGLAELDVHRPLAAYGLTSLAAAEIAADIEERLQVSFPVEQLFLGEPSLAHIATRVWEHVQKLPAAVPGGGSER